MDIEGPYCCLYILVQISHCSIFLHRKTHSAAWQLSCKSWKPRRVSFHSLVRRMSYLLLFIAREKREKSYECFVDDLKRCEQLGLELYNFQ